MMSWVRGRGTLGRHLIHYILHRPFYKRALCWSGAGALGADSSAQNSWRDRWMLSCLKRQDQCRELMMLDLLENGYQLGLDPLIGTCAIFSFTVFTDVIISSQQPESHTLSIYLYTRCSLGATFQGNLIIISPRITNRNLSRGALMFIRFHSFQV